MTTTTALVPFSRHAEKKLQKFKHERDEPISILIMLFTFFGIPFGLCLYALHVATFFLALLTVVSVSFVSFVSWCHHKIFTRKREQLLLDSQKDNLYAEHLRTTLERLMPISATDFKNPEPIIPGIWRPFRVEYVIGSTIRGDLSHLRKRNIFEGWLEAKACPDFLNMSSIMFLTEPETDRTLRVLIPNQQATQELFAGIIKTWHGKIQPGSYASQAVEEYARSFAKLSAAITHCDLIDRIAASCEKPPEKRPVITVQGIELQRGVVLATKLFVGQEEALTLPSGFLGDLTIRTERIFADAAKPEPFRALRHPLD